MPQDPREGSIGHRRSEPDPAGQDDPANSDSAAAGRRRRALGDDGTGGTRVVDLLSKHGKGPGQGTRSRRRQADSDQAQPGQAQPGQPQPPQPPAAQPPAAQPPLAQPPAAQPPAGQPPQPPAGRPAQPRRPQQPAQPPAAQPPAAQPPTAQQPPRPAHPPQDSPVANGHPGRSGAVGDGPGGSSGPPPDSPGGTTEIPKYRDTPPRRPNGPPPGRSRGEPGPQGRDASAPAPGAQAPDATPNAAGSPPPTPPGRRRGPAAPPAAPAEPSNPAQGRAPAPETPTRISEALSGSARAAAASGAAHPADADATTQHPPVPGNAPGRPATDSPDGAPERGAPASPEATAVVSTPAPAPAEHAPAQDVGEFDDADIHDDELDDVSESDEDDPIAPGDEAGAANSWVEEEDEENRTRAIDATLARFSAVHDQIAEEEAARRKRYGWLFGHRKEPEPGEDMPFNFSEGDGQSSRVEWKKHVRRRRVTRLLKAVAIAAAVTVFVATGVGWGTQTWVDAKFREVSALDPNSAAIDDAHLQRGDLNFLMVGSDTRAHTARASGVGSLESIPGARSDTTMVAHIPADRSRIVIVSFPRDLEVDLPPCPEWNAKTGKYTGRTLPARNNVKFNVAYASGGPKCTTKVVQQISGLSVTNFLGVNFQGFRSMVNAVNGVEICTRSPIVDSVLGTVLPAAGTYELDGQRALKYVRARHVRGDPTADYGRMQRQQLFLGALLRKVMSTKVLLDPGKLSRFVNAVAANTFGENISTDQLAELGQSLQGLNTDRVTFITVPTTGVANENGNEELRESATHALFRAIIEGTPISKPQDDTTRESARATADRAASSSPAFAAQTAPAQTSPRGGAPVSPRNVRVEVLNTTSQAGLAGRTADELRERGFTVDSIGDLASDAERTVIRYAPNHAEQASLLATSLPEARLVSDPAAGEVIKLELGTGFDGAVAKPDTGKPNVPDNLSTINAGKDVCGGVA